MLSAKNLNHLPVLHALLEEASVVNAARRIGLAQPTVSGILARLRDEFDDPLLVREGRTMKLTTRAEHLRPLVAAACSTIADLYEPTEFDPSSLDSQFVVAAPDHLAVLLARPLLQLMSDQAPKAQVLFTNVDRNVDDEIESQAVDLAVCGDFGLWPKLFRRPLFLERIVAVVDNRHPLASASRVSMADIEPYPISTLGTQLPAGGERPPTGVPILDARPQVVLNQFTDAVLLAIDSPIVAACPEPLADLLVSYLPIVKLQVDGSHDVQAAVFWSESRDRDPVLQWLQGLVEQSVNTIGLGTPGGVTW
jgi:DNA-binding transcriptional LysR family regulator